MNTIYPFSYIYHTLYLLQLSNYEVVRFIKVASVDSFRPRISRRTEITWTKNLAFTALCSGLLAVLDGVGLLYLLDRTLDFSLVSWIIAAALIFLLLCHFFFVYVAVVVFLLKPLDALRKKRVIEAARKKVAAHPNLVVIGIAGSYGKTTMKEIVSAVVRSQYRTLSTRGNENTPIGIARVILSELNDETEVLVLEMGEYVPGDIAHLCSIAAPDIAIITGINEAHLERMGSLERTTEAVFEIAKYAKPGAHILLNKDDDRVNLAAPKHTRGRSVLWYGAQGEYEVTRTSFDESTLLTTYTVSKEGEEIVSVNTGLLGNYVAGNISCAFLIKDILSIETNAVVAALESVRPLDGRLQPIKESDGAVTINDGYNGTPAGVREALKVLAQFTRGKKVFVTPGLIELGRDSARIHKELGKEISRIADVVVLIDTSSSRAIHDGLNEAGFDPRKILVFDEMMDALTKIRYELIPGDVVLIQNDWPDNYR